MKNKADIDEKIRDIVDRKEISGYGKQHTPGDNNILAGRKCKP